MKKRNATVAVIGAGDFIGGEIAKKFAAEGFTVFVGRRQGEKLAPLIKEIEAADGKVFGRALDARKEDEMVSFLGDADKHAPWRFASSTSAPTSIFRSSRPRSGCSARCGKWLAIPASLPVARPRA